MKVAFVVLLLAAAVLAQRSHKSQAVSVHTEEEPHCEVGEDCEEVCDMQCYNSVDGLCIDGSCYCQMEPIDASNAKALKKAKGH